MSFYNKDEKKKKEQKPKKVDKPEQKATDPKPK
jgi:hypothetical protein